MRLLVSSLWRGRNRLSRLLSLFGLLLFTLITLKVSLCHFAPSLCGGGADEGPVSVVRSKPVFGRPIKGRSPVLAYPKPHGNSHAHSAPEDKEKESIPSKEQDAGVEKDQDRVHVGEKKKALGILKESEKVAKGQKGVEGADYKEGVVNGRKEGVADDEEGVADDEEGVVDDQVGVADDEKGVADDQAGDQVGVADAELPKVEEVVKEEEEDVEERGEGYMSPHEVADAIQSGAMCKTVCPPFKWSEWSPCSMACGRGRRSRKAIYEFLCKTMDNCPSDRVEEEICERPCKFDPEKYGGPDGLDPYPINPLNPALFPEPKDYMCGHWLVEYEKLHNEMVSGKRAPSYLVFSTGKGEYPTGGGLSSRLRGITTVFFLAVLLDRAFLLEWNDPPGLEKYLVPKSFNWADLKPILGYKRGTPHEIGSWHSSKEGKYSSQWYMNTNFTQYFKKPVEVVQGHRYDFTYALLRNPDLMPRAYELGVDRVKCRLCCAWDMLFKMAPEFEAEMKQLIADVRRPDNKPIMAIQVRTKSADVQEAVVVAEHYVNCGQKVAKDTKMPLVFVPVFNNRLVVHIIAKKYKRYMKTPNESEIGTRTVHTHIGNLPADTELEVQEAVQDRTFKEFFLMLNSTVLIRTKGYVGSFGNVADAIRRHHAKPGSAFSYTAAGSTCSLFPQDAKIE